MIQETQENVVLKIEHLVKHFPINQGFLKGKQIGAVHGIDDVSFDIFRGETVSIIGESGCGKSTLGQTVYQLMKPTSGHIYFEGKEIIGLKQDDFYRINMELVYQDPYSILNPRKTVDKTIKEPLIAYQIVPDNLVNNRAAELFDMIGLSSQFMNRYPHELSFGQCQCVGIARALAYEPTLIIFDEPVLGMDFSLRARIINLLGDLQQKFGIAYLYLTHDIPIARYYSDRIMVMYLGLIVEQAHRTELSLNPLHPYTQVLFSAIPIPDPVTEEKRRRILLEGALSSSANPPVGCRFHPRCPLASVICAEEQPQLREIAPGHFVACHMVNP